FRPSWMGGWLRVQAGIFVGLAPVLLWQLQNLSLVSGLTNAFSIPLAGAILTPLSLVWAVGWGLFGDAANILLVPAGWLTDIWLWMLELCADWSFSVLQLPPRSAGAMLLGMAGSLWLCTAGLPARWLAPLLFLPLLQPLLQPAQRPAEFWLRDSGGPLQLALFQSNQALFIGASTWPRLLEPWQQGFLTNWGIGAPGVDVPLADSASLWRAESWSYTLLPLRWNGLGEPEIRQFQFGDLCEAETMSAGAMSVRVLFFKRERCVVRLDVEDDSWLLWSSISVSAQRSLLQSAKTDLAVRRVLINPSTQDRLLPALLTYWQQQDTELILTTAPPPEMQQQLERSAIRFRVLDGTGPLRFAAP
ncbi:MAG TPA: ComEC/Rec2 family competence protein, partial [Dongiaceae bacterium]|nr:ComEC/Rec2 family competence protein [Dongiaceae bacterium]